MCRQCCRSEPVVPEQKRWSLGRASSQSASRLFSWYLGRWQPGWLSESHTDHTGCPASTPVKHRRTDHVSEVCEGKNIQKDGHKLVMTERPACHTGSWGKRRPDIKKEVPPSLIFNTVPLLFFSDIPMLTHPQELNLRGSASAV